MPTFQNPVSDADAAHEALRGLAHATRTFNDPAQTYDVIGNLIAAVRSLHQVLDQVAAAHLAHRDWACTDDGDSVAGAAHAERAANALHDAAQYPGCIENNLDLASRHSGRIACHPPLTPAHPHREEVDDQFGTRLETAAPNARIV